MSSLLPNPDRGLEFWYDAQLRRLLLHFTSLFSHFKYEFVNRGEKLQRVIPARPAMRDKQVAAILNQNSENIMKTAPMITTYITDIQYNPSLQQDPMHVRTDKGKEVLYDEENNTWYNQPGDKFIIQRYMSQPFLVSMKVDIWTTNETQKFQIWEQILPLVVPSLDLYDSENLWDWAALKVIRLESIQWSSRTIPIGDAGTDDLEIGSLNFSIPTWISVPARLEEYKVIEEITLAARDLATSPLVADGDVLIEDDEIDFFARIYKTIGDFQIAYEDDYVLLLGSNGSEVDDEGAIYQWSDLFEKLEHGLRPGISQIELNIGESPDDDKHIVTGILNIHPEPNKLQFTPDLVTLPKNTINPVDGFIDPKVNFPGRGVPVNPPVGLRYIISKDQGRSEVWGDLDAKANDIIEYTPTGWKRSWASEDNHEMEILVNKKSGKQLLWTGDEWQMALEGSYRTGFWKLRI